MKIPRIVPALAILLVLFLFGLYNGEPAIAAEQRWP